MGAPRPRGSATLGTATAAGGAGGVNGGDSSQTGRHRGVCGREGERRGWETGEGQRKEKTMLDYKVLRPRCQGSWVLGPWDRVGLGRGQHQRPPG